MNIQILDSWLREHLQTKASAHTITEILSLTSVSIERVEKHGSDFLLDIEVTTNRPDLASVVGLAREAAAVLPQAGIEAKFLPPKLHKPTVKNKTAEIAIQNDSTLVNRICAVVLEVSVGKSPKEIQERLELSGIRSLNNIVDITNYVMRTIGHPTHVFDFDRLNTRLLKIREARKGEEITTLDKKTYSLPGGDIIAVDETNRIVDLLGVMGLENSVVTDQTTRILFFIDNNNPHRIRNTSMALGIRTEAAQMNEKALDPDLAMDALLYGISLYETFANAKVVSDLYDAYPNKPKKRTINITQKKIESIIGVPMSIKKAAMILQDLGFLVNISGEKLTAIVPTFRVGDVAIGEDLIEEIARVFGYHNLPSRLPPVYASSETYDRSFYFENRIKQAMKYWGFTETYTYSMVSESLYEGPTLDAVTLANPLTEDFVYMRNSLLLSLLRVLSENKTHERVKLFEIANVYHKNDENLPSETLTLCAVMKRPGITFFDGKGVVEQLTYDLGIEKLEFKKLADGVDVGVFIDKKLIGKIEVLDENLVAFQLNLATMLESVSTKKVYKPISKFPPIFEDLSLEIDENIPTGDIVQVIEKQSSLVDGVTLMDRYKNKRTFHITYLDKTKNLTVKDVEKVREKIQAILEKDFSAKVV